MQPRFEDVDGKAFQIRSIEILYRLCAKKRDGPSGFFTQDLKCAVDLTPLFAQSGVRNQGFLLCFLEERSLGRGAAVSRLRISTGFVESTVNKIFAKRMVKQQQTRWNRHTVQAFLNVRVMFSMPFWKMHFVIGTGAFAHS